MNTTPAQILSFDDCGFGYMDATTRRCLTERVGPEGRPPFDTLAEWYRYAGGILEMCEAHARRVAAPAQGSIDTAEPRSLYEVQRDAAEAAICANLEALGLSSNPLGPIAQRAASAGATERLDYAMGGLLEIERGRYDPASFAKMIRKHVNDSTNWDTPAPIADEVAVPQCVKAGGHCNCTNRERSKCNTEPKASAPAGELPPWPDYGIVTESVRGFTGEQINAYVLADRAARAAAAEPVAVVVSRHGSDLRVGWLRPEQCEVGAKLYVAARGDA